MADLGNELGNSSSPYLQQHKDNPVHWKEWNGDSLKKALEGDKPILLSVGYSACHWCHVMAHESFEDEEVAQIMNKHFINIKVDREERPDIDQVYMEAIQSMGINGGWPLHVFLTPDQKPFYGGTYFPKEGWKKMLLAIDDAFQQNRNNLVDSANKFTSNLNNSQLSKLLEIPRRPVTAELFKNAFEKLQSRYDHEWGAFQGAPKFPMPGLWGLFEHISEITGSKEPLRHMLFTVQKICEGGIYDHLGGGFARYSVDPEWHVPHFEKMLYDNGQLLSLFAKAYHHTQNKNYLMVIADTVAWLDREMRSPSGGYYSALDADSEGVEGKYYVWSLEEVLELAGKEAELICDLYDVTSKGNWEHVNVLRRKMPTEELLKKHEISEDELNFSIERFKRVALTLRQNRIAPGLDSKVISGWNGLLLSGLCDVYKYLPNDELREKAKAASKRLFEFINSQLIHGDILQHLAGDELEGFSDDYAAIIQSFIDYYECFFDKLAIDQSRKLVQRLLANFYDEKEGFFYYVNHHQNQLIASKKEVYDNVIPSSNAMLAKSLIKLGKLLHDQSLEEKAKKMILPMLPLVEESVQDAYAWGCSALYLAKPVPEIVVIGENATHIADQLRLSTTSCHVIAATQDKDDLPIFDHKQVPTGETMIFVCFDRVCQQPTSNVDEAKKLIMNS